MDINKFWLGEKRYSYKKPMISKEIKILIVAVVILFIIGVIGSRITSFIIKQPEENELADCIANLTELENQNKELESLLNSSKNLNKQLADKLNEYSLLVAKHNETIAGYEAKLEIIRRDLDSKQADLSEIQSDLAIAQKDLEEAKEKLKNLQEKYDEIVQNYANYKCCLLNSLGLGYNYKSYEIVNNDVICLDFGSRTIECK